MATPEPNQVDSITGQTTTGHEWDGIQELNTPLPRWWLWTFYATILFAIVYWVLYPAWPLVTGFSHGVLGFSSRGQVAEDIQAIQAQRAQTEAGLDKASVDGDRRRQEAAEPGVGSRQGGVRRKLLALPRFGRPGRQRLPQPHQRRLAVGRHARRHPDDDHARHPRLLPTRTRAPARCRPLATTAS